jgi:hypothetical protein
LADARTLAVHGHAAADDQVYRWQLGGCDLPPDLGGAFLGGRLLWGDAQAAEVTSITGVVCAESQHLLVSWGSTGERHRDVVDVRSVWVRGAA